MEKLKYVQRIRDDQDRRVIRLEILPSGTEVIEKVMQDRMVFLSERLIQLDKEKVEVMLKALTELHELMEEKS